MTSHLISSINSNWAQRIQNTELQNYRIQNIKWKMLYFSMFFNLQNQHKVAFFELDGAETKLLDDGKVININFNVKLWGLLYYCYLVDKVKIPLDYGLFIPFLKDFNPFLKDFNQINTMTPFLKLYT